MRKKIPPTKRCTEIYNRDFNPIHCNQRKKFQTNYREPSAADSIIVAYSGNELLDAIINRMNTAQVKTVPAVINDIINGQHQPYVKEVLDGYFAGDPNLSRGMRYSIICREQLYYSNPLLERRQFTLLPWLAGYSDQQCGPSYLRLLES